MHRRAARRHTSGQRHTLLLSRPVRRAKLGRQQHYWDVTGTDWANAVHHTEQLWVERLLLVGTRPLRHLEENQTPQVTQSQIREFHTS